MNNSDQPAMPPNAGWRDNEEIARGLTKREHFAAMAMQGILATSPDFREGSVAKYAVQQADSLLKALDETK